MDLSSIYTTDLISMNTFRKEYIWGFTQSNPMNHSSDKDAFYNLIFPLTGMNGTVTIGASFHPYQIINNNGIDIWEQVFQVTKAHNYCDYEKLINEKYFFHMIPPAATAFPYIIWSDNRLLNEINPEFGIYVPFLIPYLTFENGQEPQWLVELKNGITTQGNAHLFIDKINHASKFLMPEPTFIIGFDEFDINNPSTVIDHFVDFLDQHFKK